MKKAKNKHFSKTDEQLLKRFFGEKFEFDEKPQSSAQLFYFINNPDGTMRWVFPATACANTLLSLYNSAGWRGKLVETAIRAAFLIKKPQFLAAGYFWWNAQSVQKEADFAIFMGTVGVNRKIVASYGGHFFEKIPTSDASKWLVEHESGSLERLHSFDLQKISYPKVARTERGGLLLTNVRPAQTRSAVELQTPHTAALFEIAYRTGQHVSLEKTLFYQKLLKNLRDFDNHPPNDFTQKMGPLRALMATELAKIRPSMSLEIGFAHGDFTPWNCFLSKKNDSKLAVYDWEMSLPDAPLGFDALHFTFQSGVLLRRLPVEKIFANLQKTIVAFSTEPRLSLQLYLLFTAGYYLARYAQQPALHTQVWWLTSAWEQVLRANSLVFEVFEAEIAV
jgi:Phosphotransferase enzyme family